MGSNKSRIGCGSATFHLRIRMFINGKHKEFPRLQQHLLSHLDEVDGTLSQLPDFGRLRQLIERTSSHDTAVPFAELQSYIMATLEDELTNGQEFLKSRRKEFFCFARQNLLKHPEFIMSKVVRLLNLLARQLLEKFEHVASEVLSQLMLLANRLVRAVLSWFYGAKLMCGLYPLSEDETHDERLQQVYLSELSEYLLFFEKSERNYLSRLRFRQIQRLTSEVDSQVILTVRDLRRCEIIRKESLFPRNDDASYDVIIEYLEKMAHATLLTTKFKFICIILETIPSLFMQSEVRRHKQSSAAKRTFCMTPDRRLHGGHTATITGSFGRCHELENAYSQLLSADNKRDLAKYLLVEWFKRTDMCIIQDIYLPLQLMQQDGYLKGAEESIPLATFKHALYEAIGVEPDFPEFEVL